MSKKFLKALLLLVFLFLLGFFLFNKSPKNSALENIKYVQIAGENVRVDLALTDKAREQGLSGRAGLAENEGMLFVFDREGKYAFWMKNMNFPIDIIWLSKDLKVVYIKENALPESYPESFVSGENAKYVLEVPANFSEKNNLKMGDSVEFK